MNILRSALIILLMQPCLTFCMDHKDTSTEQEITISMVQEPEVVHAQKDLPTTKQIVFVLGIIAFTGYSFYANHTPLREPEIYHTKPTSPSIRVSQDYSQATLDQTSQSRPMQPEFQQTQNLTTLELRPRWATSSKLLKMRSKARR